MQKSQIPYHAKYHVFFKNSVDPDHLASKKPADQDPIRGSKKFCQRWSNFDKLFLEGRDDPTSKYHYKRAIIGPLAKRHLNGVSLAGG